MDKKKWKILIAIISMLIGGGMVINYIDKSITVGNITSSGDVIIGGKQ